MVSRAVPTSRNRPQAEALAGGPANTQAQLRLNGTYAGLPSPPG
jgi:hypothetical protein